MNLRFIAPILSLWLAVACSPQDDQTPGNEPGLSAPITGNENGNGADIAANESEAVNAAAGPSATAGGEENTDRIPAAMRGRWGLVAADCTSRHGDAKGLLEISDTTLTYYESRGMLKDFTEWAPDHIRADFDFSGEGMNWKREMSLVLKNEGRTLTRREYGQDAMPDALSYHRCPA